MPAQFRSAYQQFIDGGWTALTAAPEFGGQGRRWCSRSPSRKSGFGANVAFMLCPLLARGAVEALESQRPHAQLQARLLPKMVSGRVDRHHEPDRAAGRLGSGRDPHPRGAGGRSLPHLRPEDLHHLRRARPDRRTSCTWCWRASTARRPGVRGISLFVVPKRRAQRRRQSRRAQRSALRVDRAQARHPCQPDLRDVLRRSRRRDRLSDRRGRITASNTCSS